MNEKHFKKGLRTLRFLKNRTQTFITEQRNPIAKLMELSDFTLRSLALLDLEPLKYR